MFPVDGSTPGGERIKGRFSSLITMAAENCNFSNQTGVALSAPGAAKRVHQRPQCVLLFQRINCVRL
jgi:hypothetical protein